MKIYTESIKISNDESFVGVILTSDKDRIYSSEALRLQGNIKSSTIMMIRRAFSFKKNMKPLYCDEPPVIFSKDVSLQDLTNDVYISRFPIKSVVNSRDNINKIDAKYLHQLHTLTSVSFRQYYLLDKLYKEGKLNGKN